MFIRPLIAPLMAGALLAAGTAPAFAQSGDGIEIQTDDLNLDHAAGRATLERRIGNAQRQLCMGELTSGSRVLRAQEQLACKAEVRRQIYAQVPSLNRNG
jgi:UrcA family protein